MVIDAFSRRVIGWALDRTVEDELTLAALRMALELRRPSAGWVHHSDRGSQYASGDYTDLLKAHGCEISMSHKASPWENGGCESWMKTLGSLNPSVTLSFMKTKAKVSKQRRWQIANSGGPMRDLREKTEALQVPLRPLPREASKGEAQINREQALLRKQG